MSLQIKGLQKASLIDFPPYTSCVVFLSGCNLQCPFCQNPDLVQGRGDSFSRQEFYDFLKRRKRWLDAVAITGGEPTINDDLPVFIEEIKKLGYKVKLDTNGTNPEMLDRLLDRVDFVAMDIKNSIERYSQASGRQVNTGKIKKSIGLLMQDKVDYEFRITVVPGLHDSDSIQKVGYLLKGAKKLSIQNFRNKICLDSSFEKIKPFSSQELENFRGILAEYIADVEVRK